MFYIRDRSRRERDVVLTIISGPPRQGALSEDREAKRKRMLDCMGTL